MQRRDNQRRQVTDTRRVLPDYQPGRVFIFADLIVWAVIARVKPIFSHMHNTV